MGVRSLWKGHLPDQVRTVPRQLDPSRLGQPLHRDLPFQPLDLVLRDSRHFAALRLKPCQVLFEDFEIFLAVPQYIHIMYIQALDLPEDSEVEHKIRLVMPAKKEPQTAFGKRLFTLRKARGLTQSQLADALGTTQRVISYYETDAELPPSAVIIPLSSRARSLYR